jgi:hypothetical protein
MTFASSYTDFLNPHRLRARVVGSDLPSASLLLRAVKTETKVHAALTVPEMVRAFRDNGLPISAIAEIAKVERKTVYSWLDGGVEVRGSKAARVEALYRLLSGATSDYRSLYRVWNRKLDHAHSIKELLCASDLSEPAIRDALKELSPVIKRYSERDASRQPSTGPAINPLVDEMPEARMSR